MSVKPVLPPIDRSAPLAERVRVLSENQRWARSKLVPEWEALTVDIERDRRAPPVLLATSLAQTARYTGGEGSTAPRLALARRAMALVEQHKLTGQAVEALALVALTFAEINDGQQVVAAERAERALRAMTAVYGVQSVERMDALSAVGAAAFGLGRYEQANAAMGEAEALALACLPVNDDRVPVRMSSHAATLGATYRLEEGLAAQFRAAGWAASQLGTEDRQNIFALQNLGSALLNAHRLNEARAVLERALALNARWPDDWQTQADLLTKYANTLNKLGRGEDAERLWLEARDAYAKTDDRRLIVGSVAGLRGAAGAAERRGDLRLALERRRAAIEVMSALPIDHPDRGLIDLELATTLLLTGDLVEASQLADPAIAAVRTQYAPIDPRRVDAETRYARVIEATRGAAAALASLKQVLSIAERRMLELATASGELIIASELYQTAFAAATRFALADARPAEAFRYLQLANLSRLAIVNAEVTNRRAANDPVARTMLVRLSELGRQRRVAERARSAALPGRDAQRIDAAQRTLATLDRAIATASAELDRIAPQLRAAARPAPLELAAVQAKLAPGELLLAPLVEPDRTLAVAVTRGGLQWQAVMQGEAKVDALVGRVRATLGVDRPSIELPTFDAAAAAALYAVIVPQTLQPHVSRHRTLLFHTAGSLAALPPGLLVTDPGRVRGTTAWLVQDHDVAIVPSLALLQTRPQRVAARRGFLGVGAPALVSDRSTDPQSLTFRGAAVELRGVTDLPELPDARQELQAIKAELGGQVLTDTRATKTELHNLALDRFGVIAFATHAVEPGEITGLSEPALVLTPTDRTATGNDGLLTASEIAALDLDADWVILSACNTASGDAPGAAEYAGLASAFVEAGARSLLVSHWPVRDDAAARLTVDTVRAASRGLTRAAALRAAMLQLMSDKRVKDAAHPSVWAPFVLVGR